MATVPSSQNHTPRADDEGSDDATPVPDGPGPHDVPDEEVIEHTLPARSSPDPSRPR